MKFRSCLIVTAQNKEGILPSSDTVYCIICSPQIYVSQRRRARGGNFVIGFININKYTSASENVHLCLRAVNSVSLVSLLVEYLLYSVTLCYLDCKSVLSGLCSEAAPFFTCVNIGDLQCLLGLCLIRELILWICYCFFSL